jgi:sugar phosphate isomerase/epimerase
MEGDAKVFQVGISSASFYPWKSTESSLVNIAAFGCRTVEVFLQTHREYRPGYLQQLGKVCSRLGLKVNSLHGASTLFEPMLFYDYPRQVLDSMDMLELVFEAAARLKAPSYIFHGPLRVAMPERQRVLPVLFKVAEKAGEYGIRLALENVSWCLGWEPGVFKWLKGYNIPNLWFTFDNKQAARSGFSDQEFIYAMGDKLLNVHLSDLSDEGIGLVPGRGNVDFAAIASLLRRQGYANPVILETYGARVSSSSELYSGWRHLDRQLNK